MINEQVFATVITLVLKRITFTAMLFSVLNYIHYYLFIQYVYHLPFYWNKRRGSLLKKGEFVNEMSGRFVLIFERYMTFFW